MDRGLTPVVAVVCLLAVTVLGAAAVTTVTVDVAGETADRGQATVTASAAVDGQQITLANRGGAALDMTAVAVRIQVDSRPLAHQPPVPYFAAEGFRGTPTGAFNSGGDTTLAPGERATLQLASTNEPRITSGDRVRVTVRRDGATLATATAVAA